MGVECLEKIYCKDVVEGWSHDAVAMMEGFERISSDEVVADARRNPILAFEMGQRRLSRDGPGDPLAFKYLSMAADMGYCDAAFKVIEESEPPCEGDRYDPNVVNSYPHLYKRFTIYTHVLDSYYRDNDMFERESEERARRNERIAYCILCCHPYNSRIPKSELMGLCPSLADNITYRDAELLLHGRSRYPERDARKAVKMLESIAETLPKAAYRLGVELFAGRYV